ncbi:hypothetical protein, partial [Capnocytophaga sp. oral taxon 329]
MKKNLTMQLLPLWLLAFFFFASVPIKAQVKGYAGVTKLIGCGSGANANKAEVSVTNVTGGTPPYQYQFNVGAWQPSNVGWLPAGTHNVRIKDSSNNYSSYISVTVPTASVAPVITKEIFYDCDGRPTLKVGVQNPQPSYRYLFKLDNAPTFSEKYLFQNVSTGTHTITVKYEDTTIPSPRMLINEDFGKGAPESLGSIVPSNWSFQPANGTVPAGDCLHEGYYTVAPHNKVQICSTWCWTIPKDHTSNGTDATGRFYAMNVGGAASGQRFYYKDVDGIKPNVPIKYEMYLMNLLNTSCAPHPTSIDANIEIRIVDKNNPSHILDTKTTGRLPRAINALDWRKYEGTLNTGSVTSIRIEFRDLEAGNSGNDFAIDDIKVWQMPETCGQEVSTTVSVTTLQMPTISANLSNCSPSNNTLNLVVTPTSSLFTYQYQMDGGALQNSNVFTGLAMGTTHNFKVHYKPVASVVTLVNEDFGVGNNATANSYVHPDYFFEPMNNSPIIYSRSGASKDNTGPNMNNTVNGEYAIARYITATIPGLWTTPNDASHTPQGRMLLVDLDPGKPNFYMRTFSVLPNKKVDFSAAIMNLVNSSGGHVCSSSTPHTMRVRFYTSEAAYKATPTAYLAEQSVVLPHSTNPNDWKRLTLSIPATTVGTNTSLFFVLEMTVFGGCEDIAVDDIVITQALAECTKDFTTTINTSVTNAFAGVTKLIGCGTSANANKAEVTIANVEGGSGTYEYSFDGITWTASNTSWLPAGTHTVSVRDAVTHGCPFDMNVTVPAALAQPTIKTEVFYACDGKAILNVGVENPDPALKYLYSLD